MLIRTIPSLITCLALFSGCLSISASVDGDLKLAGYFIITAAIFDYFDGMFARLLHAITDFGKQLDSLADAVSFGVAPALIMFRLMMQAVQIYNGTDRFAFHIYLYLPFIIVIFAVLRLAKYNIDESQHKTFRGLPSPANGLFIAALGVLSAKNVSYPLQFLSVNLWFLTIVILMLSVLMVSNIRMYSLKFENAGLRQNLLRYLLILTSLIVLILLGLPGIILVIVLYTISSLLVQLLA